jgi:hypothetical protein
MKGDRSQRERKFVRTPGRSKPKAPAQIPDGEIAIARLPDVPSFAQPKPCSKPPKGLGGKPGLTE